MSIEPGEDHEFPRVAGQLDPYVVTELHDLLSELDSGNDLADKLIQAWIAAFKSLGGNAPDDDNSFGSTLHPDIQATFNAAVAQQHSQATVIDVCNHIIENNGWGTIQEVAMKRATAADFESAIRGMDIENLPRFMRRMIDMHLQRRTYDTHFGHATERFMEACQAIANDQSPKSARLAKLIQRLFAKATLTAELNPIQPA